MLNWRLTHGRGLSAPLTWWRKVRRSTGRLSGKPARVPRSGGQKLPPKHPLFLERKSMWRQKLSSEREIPFSTPLELGAEHRLTDCNLLAVITLGASRVRTEATKLSPPSQYRHEYQ